jgi:Transposase domain (DUF772)
LASTKVPGRTTASELSDLLDLPEIRRLIEELEATRWTGRPGYQVRAMIGLCLVKARYGIPTWTKTVELVREHWALQRALGCEGNPPSVYAAYRFAEKLRKHGAMVEHCINGVIEGLRSKLPSYGRDLSIDASDMPAFANGQRYVSKGGKERERFSDADATSGTGAAGLKDTKSVRRDGDPYLLPRDSESLTPGPFGLDPDGPGVSPTTQEEDATYARNPEVPGV